jgi:hypothetical protein
MNTQGLESTTLEKVLTLLEVKEDTDIDKKISQVEGMGRDILPALESANKKVQECAAQTAEYRRMGIMLSALIATESAAVSKFRDECITERFSNFSAVDVTGLSQALRTRTDALRLNQDSYSWLMEIGMQDAMEAGLEATWQLRRIETAQATIFAVLSEARTNKALAAAFAEEGSLAVVGGRSAALHAGAEAASLAEKQARDALSAFRERRAKLDAQRRAATGRS